ncbi:hypothetical protein F5887DRAFT_884002, partial [Amanita rubescens]
VLGPTADIIHETLGAGVDLLEIAPLPGLAPAAQTLLEIWDGLTTVDMNRTACLHLTERCADILISVREEIRDAGHGRRWSFSLVYDLIHKLNHHPFIKCYLKRDEILRQISECDKALTDALCIFSVSLLY